MARRVTVTSLCLYVGIACKLNITIGENVSFIFIDNYARIIMNVFAIRIVFKLGYKCKLRLIVNSISRNLIIIVGPEGKIIITTNGILQSFNLSLTIKLMDRSKAQVNVNMIIALNYVTFSTNAIALEQFANVKLVYNVLMLKRSWLSLNPTFELKGKTTKSIHSILVKNSDENTYYTSNRLIAPEVVNALMFYSKCTT
ncbi:MAG: hypothetical protein ACTS4U_00200 [Candidatus Hodgkinia cicadicola]